MVWFIMMQVFSTLLEWMSLGGKTKQEKDLEILLLHRQLAILKRKLNKSLRVSRVEKLSLAVLVARLRSISQRATHQLCEIVRIFQPETVINGIVRRCG